MAKPGELMKTVKGPGIFLAQFVDKQAPFNSLDGMCKWAADLGYKGIQIPTWETFLIDLDKAAESQTYCDELKGKINSYGLEITELSTHLQGQLVAVHSAYDLMFDNFAPEALRNNPKARTEWAIETMKKAAKASNRLGLKTHATFSGALLWHTWHPWPQRPEGLVELGFSELAKRWKPILDVYDENGVDVWALAAFDFPKFKFTSITSMRMAPRQEVTFHGTDGFIKLTAPFNPLVYDQAKIIQRMNDGTEKVFIYPGVSHYVNQIEAFSDTVLKNKTYPCSLEFSQGTQAMIDSILDFVPG